MSKVILLELNEVPFRVMDAYCARNPSSVLADLLTRSDQFETVTPDELALDPWISWPTLHRGVPDSKHRILHLGQPLNDVDQTYPPVWQILKNAGVSVGVFGSLHTSAIPADATEYAFYIPDYFDSDVFAHPSSLQSFQTLNLKMTRDSARNVARKVPVKEALNFVVKAPSLGVKLRTAAQVARHLVLEVARPAVRIRRRNLQPLLSIDLFVRQLEKSQPQFATFYTNHVAAAMHRYWGAAFPRDYEAGVLDAEWTAKYGGEVFAAMDILDTMLGTLRKFVTAHPEYTLVIASSMGQAAIEAEHTYEFLTVADLPAFMGAMGLGSSDWELRPAMVPCQCVVVSPEKREAFIAALHELSIDGAHMVESISPVAPMSYDESAEGFFQVFIQFDHYEGDGTVEFRGKTHRLAELGLGNMAHEDGVNCTAQHVPTGSAIVFNTKSVGVKPSERRSVPSTAIAPLLLACFGVSAPEYMEAPSDDVLSFKNLVAQ